MNLFVFGLGFSARRFADAPESLLNADAAV